MTDENVNVEVAEDDSSEEFSAAAPPDPAASGAGETSFADAEAPPASELGLGQPEVDALTAERDKYLGLAQRAQAQQQDTGAPEDNNGNATSNGNASAGSSEEEVVDAEVVDEQK